MSNPKRGKTRASPSDPESSHSAPTHSRSLRSNSGSELLPGFTDINATERQIRRHKRSLTRQLASAVTRLTGIRIFDSPPRQSEQISEERESEAEIEDEVFRSTINPSQLSSEKSSASGTSVLSFPLPTAPPLSPLASVSSPSLVENYNQTRTSKKRPASKSPDTQDKFSPIHEVPTQFNFTGSLFNPSFVVFPLVTKMSSTTTTTATTTTTTTTSGTMGGSASGGYAPVINNRVSLYMPPIQNSRFDGTSLGGSVKNFLEYYEILGQQLSWNDQERIINLSIHVTGALRAFWKSYRLERATEQGVEIEKVNVPWEDVKKAFLAAFRNKETYEVIEAQVRALKSDNCNSAEDYYYRMQHLLNKLNTNMADDRRVSYYIQGLPTDYARELYMRDPKKPEDVLNFLRSLENCEAIHGRNKRQQVNMTASDDAIAELTAKMNNILARLEALENRGFGQSQDENSDEESE